MNYLGHLYFSNNDTELMYYNLFGDFIKGSDLSEFPQKVQHGLQLHRKIDDYIDHHPIVLELLHELYDELPKISGIAVDLYFDYLLARDWKLYHDKELNDFTKDFYNTTPAHSSYFTDEFNFVIQTMRNQDWLTKYQTFEGLSLTCQRLSRRISFDNVLHEAPASFIQHQEHIEKAFKLFMNDAVPFFENYIRTELRF